MSNQNDIITIDGKAYAYQSGQYDSGVDCCETCALRNICDEDIDRNHIVCHITNHIEDNTGNFQPVTEQTTNDPVNHPAHYNSHPSGVECIEITRHYCFAIGNAIKYLWRAGLKQDADKTEQQKEIEDLEKAVWYINDRIRQLKGER